jgi:protein disulfide-isomerase A1
MPNDLAVQGYPTIYFYSSSENLLTYEGERTAEGIISFIKQNKGPKTGAAAAGEEVSHMGAGAAEDITSSSSSASVKDEL